MKALSTGQKLTVFLRMIPADLRPDHLRPWDWIETAKKLHAKSQGKTYTTKVLAYNIKISPRKWREKN